MTSVIRTRLITGRMDRRTTPVANGSLRRRVVTDVPLPTIFRKRGSR
jgi:hypothetical protein